MLDTNVVSELRKTRAGQATCTPTGVQVINPWNVADS
jgi:hypothetical protein